MECLLDCNFRDLVGLQIVVEWKLDTVVKTAGSVCDLRHKNACTFVSIN